jgi:hypothetical protein
MVQNGGKEVRKMVFRWGWKNRKYLGNSKRSRVPCNSESCLVADGTRITIEKGRKKIT